MLFDLAFCIRHEHDLRLVLLAGLVCITATATGVSLLRHAQTSRAWTRRRWLAIAGLAMGAGTWATHFVAMLGYDPGIVVGYDMALTAASLLVAVVLTTTGFAVALSAKAVPGLAGAGAIVGTGIALMHYLGMQAIQFPGDMAWSFPHVVLSVVLSVLLSGPGLAIALRGRAVVSGAIASTTLALAIILLHFMGMTALTVVPGGSASPSGSMLSPINLGLAIGAMAIVVLMLCLGGAALSRGGAIRASERQLAILATGIPDCAICMLDEQGRITSWNAGAERLMGHSATGALGMSFDRFHPAEDQAAGSAARILDEVRLAGTFTAAGWRHRKDGTRFWAHVTIEPIRDDDGEVRGLAKIIRDLTRQKQQDRIEALSRNLDAALSNMHQGLCLFDAEGRLVLANRRMEALFGIGSDGFAEGSRFVDLTRLAMSVAQGRDPLPHHVEMALERHMACLAAPEGGTLLAEHGDAVLSITHRPMPGGGWVSTFEDVTERTRSEARIRHMALHDDLTGLPNRMSFRQTLDGEIALAQASGDGLSVAMFDLDHFKEVNDTHGHGIGDQVLRTVAGRLDFGLMEGEFAGRLGGDEFAVIVRHRQAAPLAGLIARIEALLSASVRVDGPGGWLDIPMAGCVGVATYPEAGRTSEELCSSADLAMYRAKSLPDQSVCHYEPGMDEAVRERRALGADLRMALQRGELFLAYQVQRSIAPSAIVGYEALLRWRHPSRGLIAPSDFIPIAEATGEILRLGEWVLGQACRAAAAASGATWRIAVNLSPVQLLQADLVDVVSRVLAETGLPAGRLELEVTESGIVGDAKRSMHMLRRIKALGVTIAMDDFGTDHASLDALNSFPFDRIKIDRSFLMAADSNHQARVIVKAVLALGRSLGIPVLAEGLETESHLSFLRLEGCSEAQGYLLGRPGDLPANDAAAAVLDQAEGPDEGDGRYILYK